MLYRPISNRTRTLLAVLCFVISAALFAGKALLVVSEQERAAVSHLETELALSGALLDFPEPLLPIDSAAEAIGSAVRTDDMLRSLETAQQQTGFDAWRVTAERLPQHSSGDWRVRVESGGSRMPRFQCVQTLTDHGETISTGFPDNYCGYAK